MGVIDNESNSQSVNFSSSHGLPEVLTMLLATHVLIRVAQWLSGGVSVVALPHLIEHLVLYYAQFCQSERS